MPPQTIRSTETLNLLPVFIYIQNKLHTQLLKSTSFVAKT